MTERTFQMDPYGEYDAFEYDEFEDAAPGRDGSVLQWAGIGLAGAAAVSCAVALAWALSPNKIPVADEPTVVLRTHPAPLPVLPQEKPTRLDEAQYASAVRLLAAQAEWMFAPGVAIGPRRFAVWAPRVGGFDVTPLPPSNSVTVRTVPDAVAEIPLPLRNPLPRDGSDSATQPSGPQVASLPPASGPDKKHVPFTATEVALPTPGSGYAIYDIKDATVYMPNGDRLEAHSGLGDMFDDPRHVSTRMRGPTPPNVYDLKPREALFHGVEALRMTPQDRSKMYGRDGMLAHTYMLGPRGDSNGCVSFKNYDKFLAAYKRGEITKLIVVADLSNAPPRNPLLALFSGNN